MTTILISSKNCQFIAFDHLPIGGWLVFINLAQFYYIILKKNFEEKIPKSNMCIYLIL